MRVSNDDTILKLFPTCMTVFLVWNMKEGVLKNVGNQRVLVLIDFHCIFWAYNGCQWEPKLFGNQHSSKYNFTSCKFGMTFLGY